MFDFYDDIYSGTLKRKVNILSFFQNTGLKIASAIDRIFLQYLKTSFKNLPSTSPSSYRKVIKVYEKQEESLIKTSKIGENSDKNLELRKIFERNFKEIQNINEIIIEDSLEKADISLNLEKEIEDFFRENQPKNKGWLYRKSHERGNNSQNLFFCLINNNKKLISLRPKTMKKALNIINIQIHKCNFLENFEKILTKTPEISENSTFFIIDLISQKSYLIRSDESLAILSVINFYISKNKAFIQPLPPNSLMQLIETVEPYYSGLIEIACCKKNDLSTFHSDLRNYSFKSQFLEIKANKILIYQYSLKDSLNLLDYELNLENPPFSKGFQFSLEKKNYSGNFNDFDYENNLKSMKESFEVFNTLYSHENPINPEFPLKTQPSPKNIVKKRSFHQHINEDLAVIEEKDENTDKTKKKGGFKEFFRRFTIKKNEKIVLAADSEFKRKQWVFSLNYYKTRILKEIMKKNTKKEVIVKNKKEICNNNDNFFKSSIHDKNSNNPDFYDVYAGVNEEKPDRKGKFERKILKNTPMYFTEPDVKNLGNII